MLYYAFYCDKISAIKKQYREANMQTDFYEDRLRVFLEEFKKKYRGIQ